MVNGNNSNYQSITLLEPNGDVATQQFSDTPNQSHKRKISQKNKIIYLSIGILACALLLIPGVFMVQQVTRLMSQAWEKVNYQSLSSQFPEGLDANDPRIATMSATIVGRRCPQPEGERLPAGDVFLFDNETGTIYTYPIKKDTIEFTPTVLAGSYYLFFQPDSEVQPYFGLTDANHNLIEVNLEPTQTSEKLEICDFEYISNWLPPELQPVAKTDSLEKQREILDLSGSENVEIASVTPATVHGLVCNYGEDVFPAGSVIFYEPTLNTMVTHQIHENQNTFSAQVPPGNYAVFFSPQNPILPMYGYTKYVSCGLNPQSCLDHSLLVNIIEPAQEYGNINICDPQYDQTGLPEELTYENK